MKKVHVLLVVLLVTFPSIAVDAQWAVQTKSAMPTGTHFLFSDPVAIGDALYVATARGVWRYDPASDAWTVIGGPPPTRRYHFAVAAWNGRLLTFGGLAEGAGAERYQTRVEEFDLATRQWRRRADLPAGRRDPAAVVDGDRLYLVGGFGDGKRPLPMLVYDPNADTWETRKATSLALSCWGAHLVDRKVYILGSEEEREGSQVLEVWDPATDKVVVKPLPWRRREAWTTAAVGRRIYVIGGHAMKLLEPIASIDVYDVSQDRWSNAGQLPQAKSWAGAVAVGSDLYVMGGVVSDWARPERSVDLLRKPDSR